MTPEPSTHLEPASRSKPSELAREYLSHFSARLLSLGLAAFIFLPGCSWIFVKPAKVDGYPNPACSTSRVAPVLDTIQVVGNVIGIAVLASRKSSDERNPLMASWGLGIGLYTASAVYGYSNTSECIESRPESFDRPELLDPDYRPRKKKPPTRLMPEPGVMRSN